MTNKIQTTEKAVTVNSLLSSESVKKKLHEILGDNASTFATSVLQIVKSSDMLAKCEPNSILGAAMTSATLKLPLNNNIGFAYIIPFNEKLKNGTGYIQKAQFQIGYKGFIQLAMRSGQFKTLNVTEVVQGEIASHDRLTGEIEFSFIQDYNERKKRKVIGYVSYFRLLNGFEKSMFMPIDELQAHGKKFSKSFAKGFGLWKDDFDSMAKKTCLKLLLSKYAPLSVEMQTAVLSDQATINDPEDLADVSYVDNETVNIDPDTERIVGFINGANSQEELDFIKGQAGEEHLDLIKEKQKELNLKKKK